MRWMGRISSRGIEEGDGCTRSVWVGWVGDEVGLGGDSRDLRHGRRATVNCRYGGYLLTPTLAHTAKSGTWGPPGLNFTSLR